MEDMSYLCCTKLRYRDDPITEIPNKGEYFCSFVEAFYLPERNRAFLRRTEISLSSPQISMIKNLPSGSRFSGPEGAVKLKFCLVRNLFGRFFYKRKIFDLLFLSPHLKPLKFRFYANISQ